MTNILLLGAGFSKNWGAPVTNEVAQHLIADAEVRANRPIHDLLWRHIENFENALGVLQNEFKQNPDAGRAPLLLMQGALMREFAKINQIFSRQDFELTQQRMTVDKNRTVKEFLAVFDAIFTLNQDLLLEIQYFDARHNTLTHRKWPGGGCLPGMAPQGAVGNGAAWSGRTWTQNDNYDFNDRTQPFFKLHGSTNWKGTGDKSDIVIVGGGKSDVIQSTPVLKRYQDFFTEYVIRGDTRVTVIGYGFRDDHINSILKEGVENRGAQMFVIDPQGANLAYNLREIKPDSGQAGSKKSDLEEWFQKGLYSASRIPLRYLLNDETVDIGVLHEFLAGK